MDLAEAALEKIRDQYPDQLIDSFTSSNQLCIKIRRDKVDHVLKMLKNELEFDCLVDLCGVDYLPAPSLRQAGLDQDEPERFCVVYNLYSMKDNIYLRIKAYVPESDPKIKSVCHLWKAANWAEREAYDMYGIIFEGHPALRRILLPDYYQYYPLRKDYPVEGKGERDKFPRYYE